MALFRRGDFLADLIPLAPRPEWEHYHLFEARDEEPHQLIDRELAERCGVDHETPVYGARFGPEEMCDIQWSCTAAYYSWLDAHLDFKAGGSGSKARSRPTPFDDMRNWGR